MTSSLKEPPGRGKVLLPTGILQTDGRDEVKARAVLLVQELLEPALDRVARRLKLWVEAVVTQHRITLMLPLPAVHVLGSPDADDARGNPLPKDVDTWPRLSAHRRRLAQASATAGVAWYHNRVSAGPPLRRPAGAAGRRRQAAARRRGVGGFVGRPVRRASPCNSMTAASDP